MIVGFDNHSNFVSFTPRCLERKLGYDKKKHGRDALGVSKPARNEGGNRALASRPKVELWPMPHNSELPIFDPATLEQLKELVDGDDTSFLHDLFESYLTTARDSIESLRSDGGPDVLRRAAHTLKGSSLNVGASRVAELCKHLENSLRSESPSDLAARVDQIENRVQQVHEHYAAEIGRLMTR